MWSERPRAKRAQGRPRRELADGFPDRRVSTARQHDAGGDGRMQWRVLGTQESGEWRRMQERFSGTDVYFLPEFHYAYEMNGDGEACAFVAEEGSKVLFYPFFLRRIHAVGSEHLCDEWSDIESVYGYTGPLCSTDDSEFLQRAWTTFDDWCRTRHVVAEFIRFNPFLGNHRYADSTCEVTQDRDIVAVDLTSGEEELWRGYGSVHRNMVRKARKHRLVCEEVPPAQSIREFRHLYEQTMQRVEAEGYYYFSDDYYECLRDDLRESVRAFSVRDRHRTVCTALFFIHGRRIHYHLSGSDPAYRSAGPNNLLLHTVARWAQQRGFRWLSLGGGRSSHPNDSLLRFKASVGRSRFPFYVGRRVHDRPMYERLCTTWMHQADVAVRPPYFLLYRLEDNKCP